MSKRITGTWHDDPAHFAPKPRRRDFLYVGMLGGLGVTLGDVLRSEARGAAKFYETKDGPAKSVINIFLPGGMAAQESWDPKLYAPVEYKGPMGSIPTKIDGERFGELFKDCAGIADKLCVVRSMSHGEAAHERGTHNMFTGYRPSPALQFPSMGSVTAHEFASRNSMPQYVCIPRQPNEFAGSGYLSSSYGPFSLGSDPANKNFQVRDLSLPSGVDLKRFDRRRSILQTVDSHFAALEKSDSLDAMDSFYQRAYSMISSKNAREAFDLKAEPDALRKEYGENDAGMRMLMARRLVEAGVRFVTLTYGGWDHHNGIENGFKRQAPPLDKALATLVRDLDRRGMLDSTLVMVTSEFGRTPKINDNAGRDHYPKVFSIMMAGGGLKKGFVYGKSDSTSTEPEENPLSVPDWATTVYNQMGITADKELMAPGDRPIEIVNGGQVVSDLLA
ncbi:DUF1501 domain-containing protein [Planctomycetales bacterium ZRK34]|nr:DUF1501 domain-containing protein [Planctomycetales bacterium ZRK34]